MKKNTQLLKLIHILSDGGVYSGEELAKEFNVSRMAINKYIANLRLWGIDIQSARGKGYSLSSKLELLDEQSIRALSRAADHSFEIIPIIDSTNQHLLNQIPNLQKGHVCVAEYQTKGRGRRGRQWYSPFGSNLYYSMYWKFDEGVAATIGLSIAVGVTVAEQLRKLSQQDIKLKWPNDLYLNDKKMAGILVELTSKSGDDAHVVIGIGINLKMPQFQSDVITQPWENLMFEDKNQLVASLTDALKENISHFEQKGLTDFIPTWNALDNFTGRKVKLLMGDQAIEGTARGIDEQGALLFEQNNKIHAYMGGEISLRKAD